MTAWRPEAGQDGPVHDSGSARTPRKGASPAERADQDLLRRVPPHNVEAEQAVLAGILMNNETFHLVADVVREEDFYIPAHRILYGVFLELFHDGAPVDLVSVGARLKDLGKMEAVGGAEYLDELTRGVVGGANAEYYAGIVRDKAVLRNLIDGCSGIISDCFETAKPVGEVVDDAEQSVFHVSERKAGRNFKDARSLVTQAFDVLTKRTENKSTVTGVTTGYEDLDVLTSGLQPSDLIIVAARPSMGKTAFALNMAMRAAVRDGVPVAVFSLEMSAEQLIMRMICAWGKVDLTNVRKGFLRDDEWEKLYEAAGRISDARIYIDDTPALSPLDVRARTRRLRAEKGVGLVVIDYLQLMSGARRVDSREQEISMISRALKALAKELDIPVVALSQLNRKLEERGDRRPILSDLRESGAIEQDADVIMFIYRDEVYNKKPDNPAKGTAEIIIGKQRNGPIGTVNLAFLPQYTAFEDLTRPMEEAYS